MWNPDSAYDAVAQRASQGKACKLWVANLGLRLAKFAQVCPGHPKTDPETRKRQKQGQNGLGIHICRALRTAHVRRRRMAHFWSDMSMVYCFAHAAHGGHRVRLVTRTPIPQGDAEPAVKGRAGAEPAPLGGGGRGRRPGGRGRGVSGESQARRAGLRHRPGALLSGVRGMGARAVLLGWSGDGRLLLQIVSYLSGG